MLDSLSIVSWFRHLKRRCDIYAWWMGRCWVGTSRPAGAGGSLTAKCRGLLVLLSYEIHVGGGRRELVDIRRVF